MSTNCDYRSYNLEKDLKLRELLLKKEYSLNAVNNYGDSLLHVSAAYGCTLSVKTILDRNENSANINRKNKFGWTPLMHAIRADNIETVKIFLEYGADVDQRTYLGTSTLTLAAGINLEMFELIYKARPSMLKNSVNDDITPLCVAAMKNDKQLFFTLTNLGLEVKNESTYTHLVMQESLFPEIRSLAEPQKDVEDYWSDESDNIQIVGKDSRAKDQDLSNPVNDKSMKYSLPSIYVDSPKNKAGDSVQNSLNRRNSTKLPNLDLLSLKEAHLRDTQSISPGLIYNLDSWLAKSPALSPYPNPISTSDAKRAQNQSVDKSSLQMQQTQRNVFVFDNSDGNHSARDIQSSDPKRADNLTVDHNISLTFIPEFSPSRSPCLPSDFEDEDACGEDTPTPPHYKTPPQGMVLNSEQAKLVIVLRQFDLAHHISKFLAEEVDMSLFLTLNDQDLSDIGIANERDRIALLAVIDAYKKDEKY